MHFQLLVLLGNRGGRPNFIFLFRNMNSEGKVTFCILNSQLINGEGYMLQQCKRKQATHIPYLYKTSTKE